MLETVGFFDSQKLLVLIGLLTSNSLFFAIMYFGLEKRESYLFFCFYTFLTAMNVVFLLQNEPLLFLISSSLSNISLLYFFGSFFGLVSSQSIVGFAVLLICISGINYKFIPDQPNTIFFLITWSALILTLMICSLISMRALNDKKFGGSLLFITTAIIFLLIVIFLSESFYISSMSIQASLLILVVTYTVLQDFKSQQERIKSLKLKAVHLEYEMLKASIQPHFLLNTLTVLSEWIEEQPKLAIKQIDLLSKEFRFITNVAGEKLIHIGEELKICEIHLQIFNAKQSKNFILETVNIILSTKMPPMIFHTLIENGLTHATSEQGKITIEQLNDDKELSFIVTSQPILEPNYEGEGLGMTYIKSRLEEAFPGKWNLTSTAENNSWQTKIRVTK